MNTLKNQEFETALLTILGEFKVGEIDFKQASKEITQAAAYYNKPPESPTAVDVPREEMVEEFAPFGEKPDESTEGLIKELLSKKWPDNQPFWDNHRKAFKEGFTAGALSVRQQGEWQICPKCNGTKILHPPYEVRGSAIVTGACDVCSGVGMVVRPQSTPTPPGIIDKLRAANPYEKLNCNFQPEQQWAAQGAWKECCDTLAKLISEDKGQKKESEV
jgi:hypothetical protein